MQMSDLPKDIMNNSNWHNDTNVMSTIVPYIYLGLIKPNDECPSIDPDTCVHVIRELFSFNSPQKTKKMKINTLIEGSFDPDLLNAPKRNRRIRLPL